MTKDDFRDRLDEFLESVGQGASTWLDDDGNIVIEWEGE
tara:strand:- start:21 stop:137 length:117 start_codon:yes stop_codon:yes gene_type:complete